jgi:hypothetical protein
LPGRARDRPPAISPAEGTIIALVTRTPRYSPPEVLRTAEKPEQFTAVIRAGLLHSS